MNNIWILEDDSGCQFVYKDIFQGKYETRFFESIRDFSSNWEQEKTKPDLLLVDLKLKDGHFGDFISANEGFFERSKMPFIVVSVNDDGDTLRKLYKSGAVDYLTKPFNKSEILVKIERFFHKRPQSLNNKVSLFMDKYQLIVSDVATEASQELTLKEYQILSLLLDSNKKDHTREGIYSSIWGRTNVVSKTLDVHLSNLRKKVSKLGLEIIYNTPHYLIRHN